MAVRLEAAGSFDPNCARRFFASGELKPTGCGLSLVGMEMSVAEWLIFDDDGSGINTAEEDDV